MSRSTSSKYRIAHCRHMSYSQPIATRNMMAAIKASPNAAHPTSPQTNSVFMAITYFSSYVSSLFASKRLGGLLVMVRHSSSPFVPHVVNTSINSSVVKSLAEGESNVP
jgi:hypothetical protein